ncbi:TerB family tellurite resistance protein [Marinoscillum furvescens]|uniref:Tellurite resistance protein TerB n=1 Tax=Marinoscillum furvescens DSM 4134 TaxID=1122208 RepID=A0A3D9L2P4_MARFU|nr:TerB family tellurite resistance protein [Marinoscillum furvescens]RED99407.1 hypothetical protein C7460_10823 [Marinoscillum furvescens DSM 4134]
MLDFQKKKQLGILVKIAMVDDEFADEERATIAKISSRYGATPQELEEIINSPTINESLAPMTMVEKMNFMMDCMLVILADNMVTSSEEYFARQIAGKLGFRQEVIAFLIENKEVERDQMRELMIPYLIPGH